MVRTDLAQDLLIIGVHLKSEGYPNTLYRIEALRSSEAFKVTEINVPMWTETTQKIHGARRLARNLFRGLGGHFAVIARYMVSRRPEVAYVPYPSIFVLFLLSYFPAPLRPKYLVADVFISIFDTAVIDRGLLKENRIHARLLKWIESRAYRCADQLIVDTKSSARHISALFDLPAEKITTVPLSTNESDYRYSEYIPKDGVCRVLFVGTLVPLHGISTILEAVRRLKEHREIEFKFIGDGQEAKVVEAWQHQHGISLDWERRWQTSSQIALEIRKSDICLGIFGLGAKAQRVCPFKIYSYSVMGRPVVTARTEWVQEATQALDYDPFLCVPAGGAQALADEILRLSRDDALRIKLSESSRKFYSEHLANKIATKELTACLLSSNANP